MENLSAEEADISLMSWWRPKQSSEESEHWTFIWQLGMNASIALCKLRGDRSYVHVQCRRDIGDNHDIKK